MFLGNFLFSGIEDGGWRNKALILIDNRKTMILDPLFLIIQKFRILFLFNNIVVSLLLKSVVG